MKKLLLGLLIPVVLVGGILGGTYYVIHDGSTISYTSDNRTTNDILTKRLVSSFNNTKNDGNITFELDQNDFNQLICNAYSKTNDTVKKYLKGVEIEVSGNDYKIKVYTNAWVVSTVVELTCTFSSDADNYYLTITKSKIGKVTFMHTLAFSVLEKALNQETLNKQFEDAGIRLKADFKNNRFYYNKNDAIEDLRTMLNKSANQDSLISSLSSTFIASDVLSFDANSSLKGIISLKPFSTNSDFVDNSNLLDSSKLNLEEHKNSVVSLLNNNKIDNENNHPQYVFNFLNNGYSKITEDEQNYIKEVDLSSIGFKDETSKTTYLGYDISNPNIDDYFEVNSGSFKYAELLTDDGLLIPESTLNQYIQCQNLLGYSYLYTYLDNTDNTYKANYVALDNAYFNLYNKDNKEHMDMVVGINIAGYETTLILENIKTETLSYGIKLKNENIYFGTKVADDNLKSFIYTMTKDNLPENEFMTFDGNGTFTLNFEGYLKTYIDIINTLPIKKSFSLSTKVEGSSITDTAAGLRLNGALA